MIIVIFIDVTVGLIEPFLYLSFKYISILKFEYPEVNKVEEDEKLGECSVGYDFLAHSFIRELGCYNLLFLSVWLLSSTKKKCLENIFYAENYRHVMQSSISAV